MAVMRVHKNANYTIMSNNHFKEKKMSLKAKGLLSLMLSLPDDWDYSVNGLATLSKDGRDSVMSALKELEEFGYLTRTRITNEKGHFKGYDYDIFECPQNMPPKSENPTTEKPKTEKHEQLNTNSINDLPNKDIDKIDKRQMPNYLTKMLVDNDYIQEDEIFMDQYNYLMDSLEEEYGFEVVRSCIWYLIKQAKFRDIKNKYSYCKASIEQGAIRLSGATSRELPEGLQFYRQ